MYGCGKDCLILMPFVRACVCVLVAQSCPNLCNSMDYSPPGSSVHGILQARILEWVAIFFSKGSSQPGIEPRYPALQADALLSELLGKSSLHLGCHRSAVSLSIFNVSRLTQDNCPFVGIRPLLQFPHPLRAGPVLVTLLPFSLVPSSYQVLCGSIYSFPWVRYSCPLSAGVLHALPCLRVYS